jgi:CRISPR-associated protein Cas2
MFILITYDVETSTVEGQRRLRNVAKLYVNHGQRVQNSVFECVISSGDFAKLRLKLEQTIDKEHDSVRFYFLGKNWDRKMDFIGRVTSYNVNDSLIV